MRSATLVRASKSVSVYHWIDSEQSYRKKNQTSWDEANEDTRFWSLQVLIIGTVSNHLGAIGMMSAGTNEQAGKINW